MDTTNEPVAWAIKSDGDFTEIGWDNEVLYEVEEWYTAQGWKYEYIPLYTQPHPDNLGLAESIIKQQQAEIKKLKETVDKLLNHCDDPECWECGKIICPYGGEMHFHHDGCPTCAEMESPNEQ
jgi:hypothetical protein